MTRVTTNIILTMFLAIHAQVLLADLLDEESAPVKPSPAEPVPAKPVKPENKPPVKPKDQASYPKAPDADKAGGTTQVPGKPSSGTGEPSQKPKAPSGKPGKKSDQKVPVQFESKGLRGLKEKGFVELVDDVLVTQGNLKLEANKATIYFDEQTNDVIKVIADGNVKIFNIDESTGEKLQAFSNSAVFNNVERVVVMDGNARLWKGTASVIRSKKITYELDTGWIKADRVAGEMQPGEGDK